MNRLAPPEISTYLRRIGLHEIKAPTLEFLTELQRAHVQHLSWQTLDIFAGRPAGITLEESVGLILQGRSGYCFHLNGAFSQLLHSLGYDVQWHRAGVQPHGQEPRVNSFHLGMSVLLPDSSPDAGRWIVDVGLGGMPYDPIPFRFGLYGTAPFTYNLTPSSVAMEGWRLEYEPDGPSEGVDYAPEVVRDLGEFIPNHEFYSRSSDSPWHNVFLLRQRDGMQSNELRGCVLKTNDDNGIRKKELSSYSEWREVLAEVFHEPMVRYSGLEREEMWRRVSAAHEEWKRANE